MKRIILLRFHKDISLVQNRIDLLKKFNPEISIYGLFGGEEVDFINFKNSLVGLEELTLLKISNRDIKWRFSDYCILQWYKEVGCKLDFDVVHPLEYDLVLLDSLENIYRYETGDRHVYITSLIDLEKIKPEWNWYINPKFPTDECKEFEKLLKDKYKFEKLYGSMAPGVALTKEYLDGYSNLTLPLIAFDEMRLPAIAQILNIPMKDTGFVKDWFDESGLSFRLFNTDNHGVEENELINAYKSNYQKAFHPVYFSINLNKL